MLARTAGVFNILFFKRFIGHNIKCLHFVLKCKGLHNLGTNYLQYIEGNEKC